MNSHLQIQTIEFSVSGGETAVAYEARPAGSGAYPGVLVIHEWWGLTEHIQDVTRRLAMEGFVALAPDLYGGKMTNNADEAAELAELQKPDQAIEILQAAMRFLQEKDPVHAQHIGAMGFCMGGTYALLLACRTPSLQAVIPFYGNLPDRVEEIKNIRCPVLFFAGGKDQWINATKVQMLKEAFQNYSVKGEVRVYPEADHAFFNDTRLGNYHAAAAQDAWTRTLGLLSKSLKR